MSGNSRLQTGQNVAKYASSVTCPFASWEDHCPPSTSVERRLGQRLADAETRLIARPDSPSASGCPDRLTCICRRPVSLSRPRCGVGDGERRGVARSDAHLRRRDGEVWHCSSPAFEQRQRRRALIRDRQRHRGAGARRHRAEVDEVDLFGQAPGSAPDDRDASGRNGSRASCRRTSRRHGRRHRASATSADAVGRRRAAPSSAERNLARQANRADEPGSRRRGDVVDARVVPGGHRRPVRRCSRRGWRCRASRLWR